MCFLHLSFSSRVVRLTHCLLITTIAIEGGTLLQLLSTGGRHGLSGPVDSLLSWLLTGCCLRFGTVARFCLIFSFSTTAQREPRSPTTSTCRRLLTSILLSSSSTSSASRILCTSLPCSQNFFAIRWSTIRSMWLTRYILEFLCSCGVLMSRALWFSVLSCIWSYSI